MNKLFHKKETSMKFKKVMIILLYICPLLYASDSNLDLNITKGEIIEISSETLIIKSKHYPCKGTLEYNYKSKNSLQSMIKGSIILFIPDENCKKILKILRILNIEEE